VRGGCGPGVPPVAAPRNLRQITYDDGELPALSPDAKLVTYQSDRAEACRRDIWVQQVAGGSPIRLTKGPGSHFTPVFSGDGSKIFFTSTEAPQGVYEIPALGGEPRLIVADAKLPVVSPDGKNIVYIGGESSDRSGPAGPCTSA
jgi:Tol biopolymer transport system component